MPTVLLSINNINIWTESGGNEGKQVFQISWIQS